MKVLLVIDHFGSGGAQRQIVELACGLKARGHHVELFVYFPQHDFFRERLLEERLVIHEFNKGPGFSPGVVRQLGKLMRSGGFDVVVSYLNSANIYAELAKFCWRGPKLIVSERTSYLDDRSKFGALTRRLLHVAADHVVANSHAQATWLRRKPWLRRKVSCIYNGLNLRAYSHRARAWPRDGRQLRLLAVGRVGPEKNVLNVIRALDIFHARYGYVPQISWVGQQDTTPRGAAYCAEVQRLLGSLQHVREAWQWLGLRDDVSTLMHEHHALMHASLYEGLPNVICEALACGMPVLASDVCDHPLLVADGERGFLFDPQIPEQLADAVDRLVQLDSAEWLRISDASRRFAQQTLDIGQMVGKYEELFAALISRPVERIAQ
jgi:glycosyltransferase involved in cell wall biosynthesis